MKRIAWLLRLACLLMICGFLGSSCASRHSEMRQSAQDSETFSRRANEVRKAYRDVEAARRSGAATETISVEKRALVWHGLSRFFGGQTTGAIPLLTPDVQAQVEGTLQYLRKAPDSSSYGSVVKVVMSLLNLAIEKIGAIADVIGILQGILEFVPNPTGVATCGLNASWYGSVCFNEVGKKWDSLTSGPAVCGITCCWLPVVIWQIDCLDGVVKQEEHLSKMNYCVNSVDTNKTGGRCAWRPWEWTLGGT